MSAQIASTTGRLRSHYVYELVDHEGEVFYVGKGSGTRAMSHLAAVDDADASKKAEIIRHAMGNDLPVTIRIVAWFEEAPAAFAEERRRIKTLAPRGNGRVGRPLGATLTEEIRIRMEPALLSAVDNSARLAGVTRSRMIRHAVGVYLAENDAGIPPRAPGRRKKGE